MNKLLLRTIKILIGLSLLIFIIYKIGIHNIIDTLKNINLIWLIPILIIHFLIILLGTYNLYILIPKNKIKYWALVKYYIVSYSIGLMTPGSLGEFYIAKFLNKYNIPINQGLAISIIDKLITIITMVSVALLGIILFFNKIINPLILIIGLLLIIIAIKMSTNKKLKALIKFIFRKHHKVINSIPDTINTFMKKRKRDLFKNFLITLFKWVINSISMKIVFLSLNVNVPIILIFFILIIARLISLIPITYNGLGVNETIALPLYSLHNIPPTSVISVYLIFLILNYSIGFTSLMIYTITKK